MRRRSAASASRARVSSFSLTRSSRRAASQLCGDTITEGFMATSPGVAVCVGRAPLGGLGEPFDGGQAGVPLRRDRGHPAGGLVERLRADPVADLAPLAPALDEAGTVED